VSSPSTQQFVTWVGQHWTGPTIEPDVVDSLLTFKRDYLDSGEDGWEPGDLTTVLLDLFPRKVSADDDYISAVTPTVEAYINYLRSDPETRREAEVLADEAEIALPQFVAAMNDPSRWGMAKSMMMPALNQGLDLSDEAVLQDYVAQVNSLPYEEREALTGGPNLSRRQPPESFPAVRMATEPELADAARDVPYFDVFRTLIAWLGERREVTQVGWPRVKDAKELSVMLGLYTEEELARRELVNQVRKASDLRGLTTIWNVATGSGILDVTSSRVYPGHTANALNEDAFADELLHLFDHLFDTVTSLERNHVDIELSSIEHIIPLLIEIYRGPMPRDDARTWFTDVLLAIDPPRHLDQRIRTLLSETANNDFDHLVEWLIELGMLRDDADTVELSALGVWAVNKNLERAGYDAPAVEPLVDASAQRLLDGIGVLSVEDAAAERKAWLAAHDAEEAARELLAAAAANDNPSQRLIVLDILAEIGQPALGPLREFLEHPTLWRHAAQAMEMMGVPSPRRLNEADRAWLLAETLAMVTAGADDLLAVAPDEITELLPTDDPGELESLFEHVWRSGHPLAGDALELIGRHYPARSVAKSARKAAFKARSHRQP
jgi:hypothetical protein